MGLHVQHGGECGGWCGAEHPVELVQRGSVPQVEEAVGDMAWLGGCVGHVCDEHGVV